MAFFNSLFYYIKYFTFTVNCLKKPFLINKEKILKSGPTRHLPLTIWFSDTFCPTLKLYSIYLAYGPFEHT